jgi:hypothetical protein
LTGLGVRSLGEGVDHPGLVDVTPSSLYKGHRFPVEIMSHCVWLYHRFPLGVVNLVADKGVRGVLVRMGWLWCRGQAAVVAVPVIWFQVVNRSVISRRYSCAESR